MGLPIAKKSVNLTVGLVDELFKKCKKVEQNCKHVKLHKESYFYKFQTKLSQNVALGMID